MVLETRREDKGDSLRSAITTDGGTIQDQSNIQNFQDICVQLIRGADDARAKMKQIDESRDVSAPKTLGVGEAMIDAAASQFMTLGVEETAARNLAEKIWERV